MISDPNTRAVALETNEIDLIYGDDQNSPDLFQRFRDNPAYTTGRSAPLATRTVALNSDLGPTKEIEVRQAILHAVNKDAIIKGIFGEMEEKEETLLHPDNPYCNLALPPYPYDPYKAEMLLDQAGWKRSNNGRYRSKNGTRLIVEFLFVGNHAIEKAMAEVIQADLLKIGIQVQLKGLEADMFINEQKTGGFHLTFNNTWGPPYEPHAYLSSMRAPAHADYQAQAGLKVKNDIDDAITKVLGSMNEEYRKTLYRYILTTLHNQAVYLPISYA